MLSKAKICLWGCILGFTAAISVSATETTPSKIEVYGAGAIVISGEAARAIYESLDAKTITETRNIFPETIKEGKSIVCAERMIGLELSYKCSTSINDKGVFSRLK